MTNSRTKITYAMPSNGSGKLGSRVYDCVNCTFSGSHLTGSKSLLKPANVPEHSAGGHAITEDCWELLRSTNAIDNKGEFRQWLHIWTVSSERSTDAGHIAHQSAFPWVPVWDKPDLSLILATYNITGFVNFPASWQHLWYHTEQAIEGCRSANNPTLRAGPYWMLATGPSAATLARELTSMRRRISNEMHKDYGSGLMNSVWREESWRRLQQALEPFKMLSPQQELEDETVRAAEERGYAVRVRYRPAFGRPPRCR